MSGHLRWRGRSYMSIGDDQFEEAVVVADEDLDSYAYLWDGSDPGWVISLGSGADNRRIPVHRGRRVALIIEDDEKCRAVVAVMRAHGCPAVHPERLSVDDE